MLHFFPHYKENVTGDPFAVELRRLGVPHRFFAVRTPLRYKTMLGLMFNVYPRLIWVALRSAVRSLLLSHPRPTAVIIGTDIEALVFGALCRIFRRSTLVVFQTLIITPRRSPVINVIYRLYFRLILALTDIAICHASHEAARYRAAFPGTKCRFVVVPYGTTVTNREALMAEYAAKPHPDAVIVTAGRSGRDYTTLVEAISGLPCRLDIICDVAATVAGIEPSDQVRVLTDRFNWSYILTLADALFVVVPLAVDDISAGQMVLLQAAALGKAVVITRTATTVEYATDGEDALLVEMGDVAGMRAAIRHLLEDKALRERLGANAAGRFVREHSTEAYVRNLVAAIGV